MFAAILFAAVYGTLAGGELVPAPKVVDDGEAWRATASLAEAKANALGYYAVIDEPPECASNEYAVASGWEMDGNRIRRTYSRQIRPVAIPRYSVADLFYWCKINGKQETVDNALKAAGYYTVAVTTQTVEAGNETFAAIVDAVKAQGILTEAEITEALAYALAD